MPPLDQPIKLGTRQSALALRQAEMVRALLGPEQVELVPMLTSGDRFCHQPLADIGGKGLFTKEMDEALLNGSIDIAVHSLKDVPTWLPKGIIIAAVLEREDPREALITLHGNSLEAIPQGGSFATSSLRRAAQVLQVRPDLRIVPLRGNVPGRLEKILDQRVADATFLAYAGLKRLGLEHKAAALLPVEAFLPSVAQGVLAILCREDDAPRRALLGTLNHVPSFQAITAERAMLDVLDGSCRTPIAGLAEIHGNQLTLRGLLAMPDGSQTRQETIIGPAESAEILGRTLGERLRQQGGERILEACR